jgi:hypothetical protein
MPVKTDNEQGITRQFTAGFTTVCITFVMIPAIGRIYTYTLSIQLALVKLAMQPNRHRIKIIRPLIPKVSADTKG